jgi:selenocysteine lyase/cysteine desulfurase
MDAPISPDAGSRTQGVGPEATRFARPWDPGLAPLAREAFDLQDKVYALHCAEGPVPRSTAAAVRAFMEKELRPWELDWQADALGLPARARRGAALLSGVEAADISLMPNTSAGLQAIALGFPWQEGDEVLAPRGEFPSNAWPWKALERRGVTFREVRIFSGHRAGSEALASAAPGAESDSEARILAALSRRTKVLALSWVRFQDGLKLDLARLGQACQERGVHMVVDGIQGAGTHLPDLRWASAFACGSHKGLLAPEGAGFLWTSQALRAQLLPQGTWLGVEDGDNFARPSTDLQRAWLQDGRALEPGGPSVLAALALATSMEAILDVGLDAVTAHVHALQGRFLEGLAQLPAWRAEALRLEPLRAAGRLGPILALHHRGEDDAELLALMRRGYGQGIFTSVREGYLRLAFHGWHGMEDVRRLLAWLEGTA